MTSCGGDEPLNPNDPTPQDPSTNTKDVAVTGAVEEVGAYYAIINGAVNLDVISGSYSSLEAGVEWSTVTDFSWSGHVVAQGITGNTIRIKAIPLASGKKYYYRTYVKISSNSLAYYGEVKSFTTKDMDLAVDLGLPSGNLWATMNYGANNIAGYGQYCTRYDIAGIEESIANDPAWGSDWKVPSKEDYDELISGCNWSWTNLNGITGYWLSSKHNSNFIFLPAAGGIYNEKTYDVGTCGYYLGGYYTYGHFIGLSFDSKKYESKVLWVDKGSVRPVRKSMEAV